MADKNKNVVLNFRMDGQVKYAETLKEINAVMNTAAKEYRNHVSAMDKDASATDRLAAEKKKLEIQMEAASKRTQMLRAQYEAMAKDTKTTTSQLTQMYGKLLDAEKAESSLQKSMSRVNEELSEQSQEVREAEGHLQQLKGESGRLEAEQKKLTSSFKLQSAELGENASEVEKQILAKKHMVKQMQLTDRAVKNLEEQLKVTKKVYGQNSKEVLELESRLNEAKTTVAKFKNSLQSVEEAGKKAKKSLGGLGKGIQGIAGAAPAAAVAGLVSSMDEYNSTLARLNTNADQAGISLEDVRGSFNEMQVASRDADSAVEGVSNLIAAGFDTKEIEKASKSITGAAIKWSDTLNVEGLSDAIQETIASGQSIGMFDELLSRSGANIDKFNEGLEKAKKSGEEQQYVLEQLTNLGLDEYLNKYKELNPEVAAQQEAQQQMTQALSDLSIILTPMVTKVAEFTAKVIEWANENPRLAEGITVAAVVVGTITTALAILAPIVTATSVAFGALSTTLLPIIAIVVAVAAVITGIILVVKNWGAITDWIKKKWSQFISWLKEKIPKLAADFVGWINNLKSGVTKKFAELVAGGIKKFTELRSKASSIVSGLKSGVVGTINNLKTGFVNKVGEIKDGAVSKLKSLRDQASNTMQNAKDKILSPIASAKDKIFEIVDDIKGFFSGMKLSIPSIKLPKLPKPKITGGFSLSPPRVPTIKWNAKGGIFTKPTIFGQYGGRLQGAGEAGPEAALPLNKETLGAIGDGIAATMGANATQPLIVQLVTPDKRLLAEMVVDDVTKIQQRKQGRQRRNPHG